MHGEKCSKNVSFKKDAYLDPETKVDVALPCLYGFLLQRLTMMIASLASERLVSNRLQFEGFPGME